MYALVSMEALFLADIRDLACNIDTIISVQYCKFRYLRRESLNDLVKFNVTS